MASTPSQTLEACVRAFETQRAEAVVPFQKSGFTVLGGDQSWNRLTLKNGDHVIRLIQGVFEKNFLTFEPGCDSNAHTPASFTDVRDLQRQLKAQGVQLARETDERTTGPAGAVAAGPDGNPILVDQQA